MLLYDFVFLHDVANAPNINVNQISTMYQLGFTNTRNTSLSKLDDIGNFILRQMIFLFAVLQVKGQASKLFLLDRLQRFKENDLLGKIRIIDFIADLSFLLRFLCLEEEVNDEKVSWTWDYLFTSVSTEMRDEWAQDEERDDDDYEDGNLMK